MPTHFTALDSAVLIGYFVVTLAAGFLIGRGHRSVEGYTAAGRSLPGWLTGLSILGTYVSSISFLGVPGKAFATNWNAYVFSLAIPLATWIAVRWFLPFYRTGGHISAYQHLEERFGPWARVYASTCYLLTQLARMGTVMYLMALPLSVLLGWDIRWIILVTGISVTLYTYVGGLVAVIWTDAIQTVILIIGALVCAILMVTLLPGGWGELMQVAGAHDKWSLGSFAPDLGQSTFWVVLVYGLVINLQNFGIDQNYVQRYLAAKSDREARKSLWLGGLLYVPLSAIFFFIGTALFAYYAAHPDRLPAGTAPDAVFPWFIVSVLPPGVTGLLIAAIFAAAMSTVSTSLNSSATILMADVYRRFIAPQADDARALRMLHITTFVWGVLGTGVALAMIHAKSALDVWWNLAGIFGGGTLGLFLLGFAARRATRGAALAGVGVGVPLIVWLALSRKWTWLAESLRNPFHDNLTIVFGTAAVVLVGFGAVVLAGRGERPTANTQHPTST